MQKIPRQCKYVNNSTRIENWSYLYKSLSNSSATVFNSLLTNVLSCSPVCPDAATAKLYFCSKSINLFCSLTYSWRSRLRCLSNLATWPSVLWQNINSHIKLSILHTLGNLVIIIDWSLSTTEQILPLK